ncbi:hypothetical protein, partial [Gordonibacter sp.]|uniref:hypothetical protein n=1 Tax=Gordonibacter sp. TaxID=1968902 RepID=UPI002FC92F81
YCIQGDTRQRRRYVIAYDRLICEVIRSERKIDAEIFRKAVQAYVNDERHSISRLIEYASKRGMSKRVEERVGIWLV